MSDKLMTYLEPHLKPGATVDCGLFGVGWLAYVDGVRFQDMRDRWPHYDGLLGAIQEFDARGIHTGIDYRDRVVEFSRGMLMATDTPRRGDLAFVELSRFEGRPFPAMGVVESDMGDAVFQRIRGGLKRVPAHHIVAYATPVAGDTGIAESAPDVV